MTRTGTMTVDPAAVNIRGRVRQYSGRVTVWVDMQLAVRFYGRKIDEYPEETWLKMADAVVELEK